MVTAALLIAALLAALFFLPRPWLAALIGLVVAAAAYEWARLCGITSPLHHAYAVLAAGLLLASAWSGAARPVIAVGAAFWLFIAPMWLWRGVSRSHAALLAAAGLVVLVPAGVALVALTPAEALLVLALTWVADTAAYFTGRRFGRHKLAPSISPGKTWEGAAGALLGAFAYAIICAFWAPPLEKVQGGAWGVYLAATMILCVASIAGDLFESAAKRQASVKDSGTLLPGHGGILDRIDSATSTLPLAALLLALLKAS